MKINFNPVLFRDPLGIGSIIQGVTGAAQALGGAIQQHRYGKKYESLVKGYQPNKGILDYYNQALARYNVSPTESALYKRQMQNIGRGQAGALAGLQDRRSALGGVSNVLRASSDAALNAEIAAEQERNQRFGALGQATGAKAAEEKYKFENLAGLYGAKATGGVNIMNAGLSNLYGAGSSLAQMNMYNQLYGTGGGGASRRTMGRSAKALGG